MLLSKQQLILPFFLPLISNHMSDEFQNVARGEEQIRFINYSEAKPCEGDPRHPLKDSCVESVV